MTQMEQLDSASVKVTGRRPSLTSSRRSSRRRSRRRRRRRGMGGLVLWQ